ncbi:protein singed wings 2 isoform X2 [Amyelois transitella]|uniref:protein singed wings 2 isoform X2 n=1 Tax=Amyelois transitella TaxID=680683 RepID=UPI00067B7D82|nr:protein singed wings 2 isoform X2 [Amyelois transitella]
MKVIEQSLMLLSLITNVAPGFRLRQSTQVEYLARRDCPVMERITRSQCQRIHHRLICKGGFTSEWTTGPRYEISDLQLVGWPGECFNVGDIESRFPVLKTLEIINCTNLHKFKGHFSSESKIENMTMHGLESLMEIAPKVVENMAELRILDLRGNGLRHIKSKLLRGPLRLEQIYLSRNQWDCSDGGLDWLAMERENGTFRQKIIDYYDLVCHQQLYRGKPLHKVMDIIWTMKRTCPDPCMCKMTHVVSDAAGNVIPLITVDCANRGLREPPGSLPPSTTVLRLEGNKLNSIRNIIHNPKYQKLVDLILDNNSISAVKELEGSEWFNTFRVLSLRGNKLKQIPLYAFDQAFQVNNNIMEVYLGHNPWRCDCHFIPRFQSLLRKYKRVIRDLTDIRCSKSSDKSTSLISTMPLGNVCSDDVEMPISPINIVNLTLLLLIVLVVGRFLYDWRSFKATGKLPWLSSILP